MIIFMAESFADNFESLKPMFELHFQELALNKDKVPLDPQYDFYLEAEARGEVMFVVGRERGKIIGYFIGFVRPGLHYQTCMTLHLDIFWIHPEHRGKAAGFQLFKVVEQEAKNRGVQRMFVGSKVHKDASFLFEKLGYEKVEVYYSAWLGE